MLAAGVAFGQATVSPEVHVETSDGVTAAQSAAVDSLPDAPTPAISTSSPGADNSGAAGDLPLQDQPHPQVALMDVPKHFFFDEVHVFSGPAYVRTRDLKWLIPLAGATAASLSTDHYTMTQVVSSDPSFNNSANTASDWLRNTFIGVPVVFAGLGQVTHDDHMRESGILGGEAMVDAYVFDEVVKLSSWRERPNVDQGRGRFFVGKAGANSSFVSGHSIIAWSSAAVLAGEYPSTWHNVLIYTLATGVSLSRVLAQQHFPTDVLLGSASGWLIGHYVFRAHHHAPRKAAHEAPPA
jgi:membrane-associated phospholipid phosphatase